MKKEKLPMRDRCGNCFYYVHYEENYGYCHYNPPTVMFDGTIPCSAFPQVTIDEVGCHYFNEKEKI